MEYLWALEWMIRKKKKVENGLLTIDGLMAFHPSGGGGSSKKTVKIGHANSGWCNPKNERSALSATMFVSCTKWHKSSRGVLSG